MYDWAKKLFPINRSILGDGIRETLSFIAENLDGVKIHSVPTGTKVFDWDVPQEWSIEEAYIEDAAGNRIIDFNECNLHVVGYSSPVDTWMSAKDLQKKLHSIPDLPNAIPYVTSYYSRDWGFCIPHKLMPLFENGNFHAVIKSSFKDGFLNYGELVLKGETDQEVFISTYVCHPSMANNELSGPVLAMALARWLSAQKNLKYTYRFIFIPETIGSITYLSKNYVKLKKSVIAGFNLTCVGDERAYSYMPSADRNSLVDRVARIIYRSRHINYKEYSLLERGSDERQYCWPGIELPVVSLMRSKYWTYPEYHTSLDNLAFITPKGLLESFNLHVDCLSLIEKNCTYIPATLCEPNLGRRKMYPTISTLNEKSKSRDLLDLMFYMRDGRTLVDLIEFLDKPYDYVVSLIDELLEAQLILKR
ncbi:DUF4910 domain-containing protein [Rhodobacterales bacterium FZCC0069]|nr:DUF4910 domain-containing protein [Rhodobacterales bacterium FZCC0069]